MSPALPEHFNWELFDHLPCSSDLAPSDYHLFTYLKNWLESQIFNNNEEMMEGVKTWLSSQAADLFDTGIPTLIPRYNKCLNFGGYYVVKQLKYVVYIHIYSIFFSLLVLLTAHRRLPSD
jgi:hypothetical protein